MQKPLLLCLIAVSLTGCAPNQNPVYRAREARSYPDPTLGTDNRESQWYKTQILASPSPAGAAGAPVNRLPAQLSVHPVSTRAPASGTNENPQGTGVQAGTGNPG